MTVSLSSYEKAIIRSDGRCEAMVQLPRTWTRCGRDRVEVHHALTRARGGDMLDRIGEWYHLIVLCQPHHKFAHELGHSPSGLMIDGSVYRDGSYLVYEGPDAYLRTAYGKEARYPLAVELSVVP